MSAIDRRVLLEDLTAQRALLARGELSSVALIGAQLAAIADTRDSINAYIALDNEGALRAAQASDARRARGEARPLEGLGIAVKDNLDVAGMITTAGMATRRDAPVAEHDSAAVEKLRAAGAVILGKLNMHEAALGADNDNPHFGACHHPSRHGYTPGGSSGGSAAAAAAGLCSAALGSDSMGSLRIPSSYCGTYAIKPSYGLISPRGSVAVSRRLDHIGPITRSARDLALLLPLLAGFDAASAQSRGMRLSTTEFGALQIGVPAFGEVEVEEPILRAYAQALDALQALGHRRIDLPAPLLAPGRARRAGLLISEAEMLFEHADDWARAREKFSTSLSAMLTFAETKSARDLVVADHLLDAAQVQMQQWLSLCDVIVWPTTPQRAFAFGSAVPANQADLTCFANMAGVPALSLPLPVAEAELPIGLQLIGRIGDDLRLIALAESLQHSLHGASR